MIYPVYIIAANDFIEDKNTNLVSIISVIERISFAVGIAPIPHDPRAITTAMVKCVTVWRFSGDEVGEFEHQFVIDHFGELIESPLMPFDKTDDFFLKRFMMQFGFPLITQSGWIFIRSRVRRVGSNEWTEQAYPIEVVAIESHPEPTETSEPA